MGCAEVRYLDERPHGGEGSLLVEKRRLLEHPESTGVETGIGLPAVYGIVEESGGVGTILLRR